MIECIDHKLEKDTKKSLNRSRRLEVEMYGQAAISS